MYQPAFRPGRDRSLEYLPPLQHDATDTMHKVCQMFSYFKSCPYSPAGTDSGNPTSAPRNTGGAMPRHHYALGSHRKQRERVYAHHHKRTSASAVGLPHSTYGTFEAASCHAASTAQSPAQACAKYCSSDFVINDRTIVDIRRRRAWALHPNQFSSLRFRLAARSTTVAPHVVS